MAETMREYAAGKLRSGSKHGPPVKSRKQAVAIGLSEARKAGEDVPPPKENDRAAAVKAMAKMMSRKHKA